jgi:hypothetical protein
MVRKMQMKDPSHFQKLDPWIDYIGLSLFSDLKRKDSLSRGKAIFQKSRCIIKTVHPI